MAEILIIVILMLNAHLFQSFEDDDEKGDEADSGHGNVQMLKHSVVEALARFVRTIIIRAL